MRWCCWQPNVVALATALGVENMPIHVLNMSETTAEDPLAVTARLREPLLALASRIVARLRTR
jgi:hypothetical protein